jgi:Predicted phosphohydrolases
MANSHNEARNRRSLSISNSQVIEARTKAILREKDSHIVQLQKEVAALTNKLAKQHKLFLQSQNHNASAASSGFTNHTPKRRHHLSPFGNVVQSSTDSDYGTLKHERSRMGRNASIATAHELNTLYYKEETRHNSNKEIVHRILDMFQDPKSHISYLRSMDFAKDILRLTKKIKAILEAEPRVAFVQSPAYVFGDIHGNLEDLHFFSDNVWRLGMALTAGNFVFLGDYVDRGMSCLECIAYLFSMKLLLPHKVFLLRGNHETRDVNGEFVSLWCDAVWCGVCIVYCSL